MIYYEVEAIMNKREMIVFMKSYVVIAMTHLYTLDGFNNPFFGDCIKYVIAMAISYSMGAICYVLRIPDRFCPGMFDYVVCF